LLFVWNWSNRTCRECYGIQHLDIHPARSSFRSCRGQTSPCFGTVPVLIGCSVYGFFIVNYVVAVCGSFAIRDGYSAIISFFAICCGFFTVRGGFVTVRVDFADCGFFAVRSFFDRIGCFAVKCSVDLCDFFTVRDLWMHVWRSKEIVWHCMWLPKGRQAMR
jgi:hypothetical protein